MKIALAGNPNVGKSTVFNNLTGMHQHTGNWIGKTVSNARGLYLKDKSIEIFDLPGTYSLSSSSREEEVARDFICFANIDACIIICDALCLEKNMNLVLQILEINKNVVLGINMMDEAEKKGIEININLLSKILDVPVVPIIARKNQGIDKLIESVGHVSKFKFSYPDVIEECIDMVVPLISNKDYGINNRWLALKLISDDTSFNNSIVGYFPDIFNDKLLLEKLVEARLYLQKNSIYKGEIDDLVVSVINENCVRVVSNVIFRKNDFYLNKTLNIDKVLTSKFIGIPIMLIGLFLVFWLTIVFANYPSELLFKFFSFLEKYIVSILSFAPKFVSSILIDGIYRVLTWVISVMLPPMLIFFPIFTLLEDLGYLPRVAFTLDNTFRKCCSCGKQSLTMAMGFGCNAVGVTGSRIIDSKRERLISIITNVFVPCNGRFPTIIMLISIFFVSGNNSFLSSLILVLIVLSGIFMTFLVSYLLSKTVLKGEPSSFVLELPPYRKPVIMKTIIRSICDKTLNILSKTVKVSIISGILIWLISNIFINDLSLLNHFANFFNGFGVLIGLDGAIIVGFLLGFPANEIVFPIILMIYMSSSNICELPSLEILKEILISNNWTFTTALCMVTFCLFHFPCSTTCLTIKDETKSFKWTMLAFILPTIIGIILCFMLNLLF